MVDQKTKYTPANNSDIENDDFVPKWELIEKKETWTFSTFSSK